MMTKLPLPKALKTDEQSISEPGTQLAFQNAYRVKKKFLITEIQRAMGVDQAEPIQVRSSL